MGTNGRSYMGEYRNDQKEGYGWFKWPDGSQYEGEWRDGKQHGTGTFLASSGEKNTGLWEGGRPLKDDKVKSAPAGNGDDPPSIKAQGNDPAQGSGGESAQSR